MAGAAEIDAPVKAAETHETPNGFVQMPALANTNVPAKADTHETPSGASSPAKGKTGHARPNGKTRRARAAQQQDKEAQAAAAQTQVARPIPQQTRDTPNNGKQRQKDNSRGNNMSSESKALGNSYSNGLVDLQNDEQLQWLTDDFFMYQFKCVWCPITVQHNWQTCLYAHNYQDARRNPQMGYGPQPCPHWDKKERAPLYGQRCPNGVLCPYSHGAKEQLYHPQYYKTVICWDFSHTKDGCPRHKLCAFYHVKRSQRRGPALASLTRTDYTQLLVDDALQFMQSDFGCPPFTSSAAEEARNGVMAPTIPYAPIQPMATMMDNHGVPPSMPPPQMMNDGYGDYWYDESQGVSVANTSPMQNHEGYQSFQHSPMGSHDGTPVGHGSPNQHAQDPNGMGGYFRPPMMEENFSQPNSPSHHGNVPRSPYGQDGGWSSPQQGHVGSPHSRVVMVPMVPQSPHGQQMIPGQVSPMHAHHGSPHGGMVQGNMVFMPANMDGSAPFGSIYDVPPPNHPPPQPKKGSDDDLFDVKSFDSMEMYDQAMPILPPAGLQINRFGVLMTDKGGDNTTTTNSGEGTSASASNSD